MPANTRAALTCRDVAAGLSVHSTFERSEPVYTAAKRARKEQRVPAAAAGGSAGPAAKHAGEAAADRVGSSRPDAAGSLPAGAAVQGGAARRDGGTGTSTADAAARADLALASRPSLAENASALAAEAAAGSEQALPGAAQGVQLEPAGASEAAPGPTTFAHYYAERWGQASLAPDQPLLLAARVSRHQLARGLDLRRPRKCSYALRMETEGGRQCGRWAVATEPACAFGCR